MQRREALSYITGIQPFPKEESKCIETIIKNKQHELVMMKKILLPVRGIQSGKMSLSWRIDTMQVSGILGCDVKYLKTRNGGEEKWSDTSESP